MRKLEKILTSPMFYILFFLVGTIVFCILSFSTKVPVYETVEGMICVSEEDAVLQIKDDKRKHLPEQIHYYINRDEWVETAMGYDVEEKGYPIENMHNLENGTIVKVDMQKEQMTLFEVIFRWGGNV